MSINPHATKEYISQKKNLNFFCKSNLKISNQIWCVLKFTSMNCILPKTCYKNKNVRHIDLGALCTATRKLRKIKLTLSMRSE